MHKRFLGLLMALCCCLCVFAAPAAAAEPELVIVQMTPEEKKLYDEYVARLNALFEDPASSEAAGRSAAFGTLSALIPSPDTGSIRAEFIPEGFSQPYSVILHSDTLFIDSATLAVSDSGAALHEGDSCFMVFDVPAEELSAGFPVAAVVTGAEEVSGRSCEFMQVDHLSSGRSSLILYPDAAESRSLEIPASAEFFGEGALRCGAQVLVFYDAKGRPQRLFLLPDLYEHTLEISGSKVFVNGRELESPAIIRILDPQSPSEGATMLSGVEVCRALGYVPLWNSLRQTLILRQNAQTCASAALGQTSHPFYRQNSVILTEAAAELFGSQLYLPLSFFSQLEPALYISIR